MQTPNMSQFYSWTFPVLLSVAITACGKSPQSNPPSAPPASVSSTKSSVSSAGIPESSTQSSMASSTPANVPSDPSYQGKGLAASVPFPLGIAIPDGTGTSGIDILNNTGRQNLVKADFSQITLENKMKMKYSLSDADRYVNWAKDNGLGVHGHALVWHPDYQLPSWTNQTGNQFKASFKNHITNVAKHFKGRVTSWDVVNEALYDKSDNGGGDKNGYRNSVFLQQYGGPSYIAEAFRTAKAADPDAILYYNDFNTEENQSKTDQLVKLIQSLLDQGVPIDGVGFQMHVLPDWASLDNIRASIRKIVELDDKLLIKITEFDVRVNNPYDGNSSNDYTGRDECSQSCEGLQVQKARYRDIIKLYLEEVPVHRRGGITIWGIADQDSWFYKDNGEARLPDWPLLFNNSLQKKPAFYGLEEALKGA